MISDPKPPALPDLHAAAKALYLDLCAHHVENADLTPDIAEARNMAENVALKIGSIIRSKVNGARLEGEA